MTTRLIESWLLLAYFGFLMKFRGFSAIHSSVRQQQVRARRDDAADHAALCHAMDLACVFYFKRILCLQRSAATTVLFRRHGWRASMVLGTQLSPFQSHAWVEVDGCVVNDKPYVRQKFRELERC